MQLALNECDVTSGVHSCTILGYFTIAANGKSYLRSHVQTVPHILIKRIPFESLIFAGENLVEIE